MLLQAIRSATPTRREAPLLFAVFLDLIGFGMAFMDIQLRLAEYGAQGWMIGGILSSYFLVQLIASPFWGRLSDRVGRKPILLVCTFLAGLSMVVYGLVPSIIGILLSRILGGLGAANVVVGQAYIADITDPEARAGAMGRVSAAILIGLIAGPGLGGWIADHGGGYALGMTAAGMSALSFLWILFGVKRLPPAEAREPGVKRFSFRIQMLGEFPDLRRMLTIAMAGWFVLACLEGTFARLLKVTIGGGRLEPSLIFSYESLLGAFVGLLLGVIATKWTSNTILRVGYLVQGLGVALTPMAPNLALVFAASTLYALGIGVVNPTINSVSSEAVPDDRQGELFGLLQAARSFGFLVGPVLGSIMFDLSPGLPYFVAGGVAILAALLVSSPSLSSKPATT